MQSGDITGCAAELMDQASIGDTGRADTRRLSVTLPSKRTHAECAEVDPAVATNVARPLLRVPPPELPLEDSEGAALPALGNFTEESRCVPAVTASAREGGGGIGPTDAELGLQRNSMAAACGARESVPGTSLGTSLESGDIADRIFGGDHAVVCALTPRCLPS